MMKRRTTLGWASALALWQPCAWAQGLRKVSLALWSKPITEIAHLLAEEDKGFFRAQGLDLNLLPGAGGGDAVRNLLSGQADIAFTDPGSLFAALDKGEKLRVIYDIYPQNVFNVVALKSSGIQKPADLKGKRVGVYSLASGTRQNLQLMLAQAGLKESDITLVVTGLLNFAPLMQGQVDATAATDTGLAVARQRGLRDMQVMEVRDWLPLTSDVLVVRDETYQQHKALLRAFVRAWRDSVQWSLAQPEQAAWVAQKKAIDGQNLELNREIVRLRNLSSVSAYTQRHGLGAVDIDALQKGAQAYQAVGLIARAPDMKTVVATDVLP
ncbi:MAG: ABC transporter substrate-binding protein [Alphaproteobacteria bacterium]|nr:ABC transporter substrate-binding protein [Alphaproteobacteria bacterium]